MGAACNLGPVPEEVRPKPARRNDARGILRWMAPQTFPVPFRLVLAWHPGNRTAAGLVEQIRARFQGDDFSDGHAESGINTGALRLDVDVVRRSARKHPWAWCDVELQGPRPVKLEGRTQHLIVAFIDHRFAADPGYVAWLEAQHKAIGRQRARKGSERLKDVIFPVLMTEGDRRQYSESGGRLFDDVQGLRYDLQPDAPLRAPHLMLRLVYEACRLLSGNGMRVFLSHAKSDGLPLAQSMRSLISDLEWLPYFYDVKDLAPGQHWQEELRRGVRNGALIILRTGAYDGREWCRAEVSEALQNHVAILAVEAAGNARRDRSPAYLNNIPVVRVADGDLFRPLEGLLREELRCLVHKRLVEGLMQQRRLPRRGTLVLVRPPELDDLFRFRDKIKKEGISRIVYPAPTLPRVEREMLEEVASALVGCTLASTEDFYGVF